MENITRTVAIDGSKPILVTVECSATSGFAGMQIVGNSSEMCRDGKERARTALEKLGLRFGQKRILINLSPADSRREGNHFDLPIAVSLAALSREEKMAQNPADWLFAAELSLEGQLRPTRAIIPMLLSVQSSQLKGMVISRAHRREIAALGHLPLIHNSLQILYFDELKEVIAWLFEGVLPEQGASPCLPLLPPEVQPNFDDMHLSPELEDLAVSCAVGRHSLLLRGSPGAGKSMFAQRLPSIVPPLAPHTQLEALQVHSLVHENLPAKLIAGLAPFRHPHHGASAQAIIGTPQQPGDLALAHGGILFLDELPEFRRDLLEALREPLEQGWVNVSRAQGKTMWKSSVQFIAACNNCPCGWSGSKRRACRCSHQKLSHYRHKLSGPILDRIDIHFNMPELSAREWRAFASKKDERPQKTRELLKRVEGALSFSQRRLEQLGLAFNSSMGSEHMRDAFGLKDDSFQAILDHLDRYRLSNRALLRSMRVARTLADLNESKSVRMEDVERAAQWQHDQAARARGETSDLS